MSVLEERIRSFDNLIKLNYTPIKTTGDLNEFYNYYKTQLLINMRTRFPINYLTKLINWNRLDELCGQGIGLILAYSGEGIIKEWEVYSRSRQIPDANEDKLKRIVDEVYGSIEEYKNWGQSLIYCADALKTRIKEQKFSILERILIKPIFNNIAESFRLAGNQIMQATKE